MDSAYELDTLIRDKMAKYMKELTRFSIVFFFIFLTCGIWHAFLAINLNNSMFKLIAGDFMRNISWSICGLSFGSLFVIILLLMALYYSGFTFRIHLLITILCIAAIFSNIGLTIASLFFSALHTKDHLQNKIEDLIQNNSTNPIVSEWMKGYSCTNVTNCRPDAEFFIRFRCDGEAIACGILLFIMLTSICGITAAVIKMGLLKRPQGDSRVQYDPLDPK
ncbi:hypothetical protein TVAG_257800 [Trichomonas vaginalis G3]|uniref:Tetraspanin family protein n=1 Tax=Trichomonas vaginalis (strain ATCC PRA-98 / G3) TaxID=412133 RepID=A2F4G1_TRIV3|nr:hypothetical protein TVAGG3_1031240 [Trichomonas vaginalis G3]EAY00226.1 hypothetical protein TVAG_257800 [Trichomonas vaginalis G3]KAI5492884.1 hypothetical protein TVAGG3_1031240 [Trichomonas vaginalis G3]|eukprot:XP_001313155.1 hypothetical protein [Trichomonas vaginalis G3]